MPSHSAVTALVVAGLLALAGCDEAAPGATPAEPPAATASASTSAGSSAGESGGASTAGPAIAGFPTYVALGDSYTAAPGVPDTEQETGCFRSSGNYPALLADRLNTELVDVSCSGATTLSLVGAQGSAANLVPPQFDALRPDTSLVTLGIGANDLDFFATLAGVCSQLGLEQPRGAPCRDQMSGTGEDVLLDKLDEIGGRVTAALEGIRDRSPEARVFLVGYPQPVPATGQCREVLPLAAGDYPYVRSVVEALGATMAQAAERGGATYVDMLRASEGHDICAGEQAWVNGIGGNTDRAIALHPFAEEQQAVADLVLAQLDG